MLTKGQAGYKQQADRRHQPAPFKVGDWMLLSTKNLHTLRPSNKQDCKRASPVKSWRLSTRLPFAWT